MFYKITNLTNKKLKLDKDVYVSAARTEVFELEITPAIERLQKLGVIKYSTSVEEPLKDSTTNVRSVESVKSTAMKIFRKAKQK